jgi:hypothetical protein
MRWRPLPNGPNGSMADPSKGQRLRCAFYEYRRRSTVKLERRLREREARVSQSSCSIIRSSGRSWRSWFAFLLLPVESQWAPMRRTRTSLLLFDFIGRSICWQQAAHKHATGLPPDPAELRIESPGISRSALHLQLVIIKWCSSDDPDD